MSKTFIVTGANGNLGTAVVKKLLEAGHHIIGVDHSGRHMGFADQHPGFELHTVNLADEAETSLFVQEAIGLKGTLHGALLLAGGFAMGNLAATDGEALKKMFSLNFNTAYHIVRPLFNHLLQNGYGRIVLTGARPALVAANGKDMMAYALSKSLLFTLAEQLNEQAKGTNVVTSVIVPSTIDTPPNRESMPKADTSKWVKPEQIAEVLAFICSDHGDIIREPVYKLYNNA